MVNLYLTWFFAQKLLLSLGAHKSHYWSFPIIHHLQILVTLLLSIGLCRGHPFFLKGPSVQPDGQFCKLTLNYLVPTYIWNGSLVPERDWLTHMGLQQGIYIVRTNGIAREGESLQRIFMQPSRALCHQMLDVYSMQNTCTCICISKRDMQNASCSRASSYNWHWMHLYQLSLCSEVSK